MRLRALALRANVMRHRRIAAGVAAVVLVALVAGAGALAIGSGGNPSPTQTADHGAAAASASGADQTTGTPGASAASSGPSASGSSASGSSATTSPKPGPTLKPGQTPTHNPNATPAVTTITMRILPSLTWQPVKIPLSVGDRITFSATGSYRMSDTGTVLTVAGVGCSTPKTSNAALPAPKLTPNALVGRSSGLLFCIGASKTMTVTHGGYIEVTINDDTRNDDTGSITIDITVTHKP